MTEQEVYAEVMRLVGQYAGKSSHHDFFRALHEQALLGMGFVGDASLNGSGEAGVLRYIAGEMRRRGVERPVIFDVGANHGDYALAAAKLCPAAVVYAFEPSGAAFSTLTQALAGNACQAFNIGFSDTPCQAPLYADHSGSALGSLYRRDLGDTGPAMRETETIRLDTLDRFCTDHGIDRIHFLKIDVEGHEIAVLKGAAGLLSRGAVDFIQFEFGGADIDSRTFLRDFWHALPGYSINRIVKDGIYRLLTYKETDEIFCYQNFLAIRQAGG